jgi:hypothetical protein
VTSEHPSTESADTSHPSEWQPGSAAPSGTGGVASVQQRAAAVANDRPEAALGAAFAGGFLLAMILRRLAR